MVVVAYVVYVVVDFQNFVNIQNILQKFSILFYGYKMSRKLESSIHFFRKRVTVPIITSNLFMIVFDYLAFVNGRWKQL